MKKIDIQITKAQIESYSVELVDGLPDVTATISLYTANNKKISTFALSTKSWQDCSFNLPPQMIPDIKNIASRLEEILIRECKKQLMMLPAPK